MVRLASPLFLEFIETRSPARNNLPVIESSDRRLRDTEILFTSLDKERFVNIDKMGFKKVELHWPTNGDRKQEKGVFHANG